MPPRVIEVGGLRFGVLICYDLRFPEAARICALEGADLIALPTNWPVGRAVPSRPLRAGPRGREPLLPAGRGPRRHRARDDLHGPIRADRPRRGALAVASDTDEELLIGEVDPEAARRTHVRRRPGEHEWDTIADRRPGLYARLGEPGVDRLHQPVPGVLTDLED